MADGGQYRNDWDSRIREVLGERDALWKALSRIVWHADGWKVSLNPALTVDAIEAARPLVQKTPEP